MVSTQPLPPDPSPAALLHVMGLTLALKAADQSPLRAIAEGLQEDKTMADKVTLIAHSGDMDKVYSALIIANGALAMGMEATI